MKTSPLASGTHGLQFEPTTNSECPDGAVEVTGGQGRIAHVSLRRGAFPNSSVSRKIVCV